MNTNSLETPLEPIAPVAPIEQTFTYQPTDENGLPIGGKQVIKYTDPAELPFLLAEQSTLLIRKLREQTRKNRLGIIDKETIDESAQRTPRAIDFKPKSLSKEQRAQLSRDILDEETFDSAITTVFETAIGASAEDFRNEFTQLREDNNNLKAIREVEVFQSKNPEYVVCDYNAQAIVNWLIRNELALTAANFQTAYNTLKSDGLLITSLEKVQNPTYVPPTPAVIAPDEEPLPDGVRIELPLEETPITIVEDHPALHDQTPPPAPKPVSRVPVSLNRSSSSGDATPAPQSVGSQLVYKFVHPVTKQETVYTGQAALDAMPSEEYKRRLSTPGFRTLSEKIEAETAAKRQRR